MNISKDYVVVEKLEEPKQEGFQTIVLQDSSTFKGKVKFMSGSLYVGDKLLEVGDTVLFAKYSPNTHDIEHEGLKLKFVAIADVLAVL